MFHSGSITHSPVSGFLISRGTGAEKIAIFAEKSEMNHTEIEKTLIAKGVRPTPNRVLVMKELMGVTRPVNLADLEVALAPMDKASIFRVLDLFARQDIIHVIEDGSRSFKYELCHNRDHHSASDQHAHFYCEKCGKLTCLDDIPLPPIDLPRNYEVRAVNFMFKGTCPECRD